MGEVIKLDGVDRYRRRLLGAAVIGVAAAQFAATEGARAQSPPLPPGAGADFAPLKQVDAGLLNVAYAEAGPGDGPAVILLHGWPYDIYSFADVAPLLAAKGYRVIVPYLRGYGATRFLAADAFRNGQPTAVALDIIAALWPQRCKALVSVSGYLIGSQASGEQPLPPEAEVQWWYQF